MAGFIENLRSERSTNAARFGSKAANQAMLGQAGLPIPEGFCLDAGAYRKQLASIGLANLALGDHCGK